MTTDPLTPPTPDDRRREWLAAYLDTLPANIRPKSDDHRFLAAAGCAYRNRWTGAQIARLVAGYSYANAMNPPLVAIMHLERLADRPPHAISRPAHASGCLMCAPGHTCPDPITVTTPDDWARERFALLSELGRTWDMSERERGEAMRILIEDQHRSPERVRVGVAYQRNGGG